MRKAEADMPATKRSATSGTRLRAVRMPNGTDAPSPEAVRAAARRCGDIAAGLTRARMAAEAGPISTDLRAMLDQTLPALDRVCLAAIRTGDRLLACADRLEDAAERNSERSRA
jgi:hypothetical protein